MIDTSCCVTPKEDDNHYYDCGFISIKFPEDHKDTEAKMIKLSEAITECLVTNKQVSQDLKDEYKKFHLKYFENIRTTFEADQNYFKKLFNTDVCQGELSWERF